jgi:signal transduction histidine kinase
MVRTPFGRFSIVVYGASFHWDDLLYLLYYFPTLLNLATYLLLFVALSFGAWIVVRKSLEPLRRSAATVSQISLDSLDERLPADDAPSEIAPFIEAVNAAFRRVKEGVARQRRFIANSAHELRTPIAILRARLDALDDTPVKRDLKRDAQRVQTILEQLLVLAQLEERGRVAEPPEADIGEIVLAATADFAPLALGAGRRIIFEPSPTRVAARAYPWAVECVVTNLLDNALRAEPAGGAVVVRVTPDGGVDVADHGEGVAAQCREQIFEPFWRKNDATPGTGLGLAIARELMEKQGGRIWVEETPGGGATFKLRFSALAAAPFPPPRKAIDIAGAPV